MIASVAHRRRCNALVRAMLAATGAALFACGAGGAARASAPAATFVTYSGTFTTHYPTSTDSPRGVPGDVADTTISWQAKAAISAADIENRKQDNWHYTMLEGTFDYTLLPQPGSRGQRCNKLPLHEKPGYESTPQDALNLFWDATKDTYMVTFAVPFNGMALTTGLPQDDPCAAFAYWPEPSTTEGSGGELGKEMQFSVTVPAGGPYVFHQPKVRWNVPTEDAWDEVDSTVVISAGVKGASAPPATTPLTTNATPATGVGAKDAAKQAARRDFETFLPAAEGSCFQEALGLATLGTGGTALDVVMFTVPGGAPLAGTLTVTGAMMVAAATPICTSFLKRLIDDARIVKDPPLASLEALAAVAAHAAPQAPSCARWHGPQLTLCTRLRSGVQQLLAALTEAGAVDDALVPTIDRESGALAAGRAAEAATQAAALRSLDARFATAVGAEDAAWGKIASVLHGAGVAMRMSSATDAKASSVLKGRLAAGGLPDGALTAAGGMPAPRQINLLTQLPG